MYNFKVALFVETSKHSEHTVKQNNEMPTPEDKEGVQRLFGMTNFLQRFAPQLSEITSPLRDLAFESRYSLRMGSGFPWTSIIQSQGHIVSCACAQVL